MLLGQPQQLFELMCVTWEPEIGTLHNEHGEARNLTWPPKSTGFQIGMLGQSTALLSVL